MPPTGAHGLVGIILSSRLSKTSPNTRTFLFFGSVFPDLDIFGSIILAIVGFLQGYSIQELREPVILFHRSITHNIFLIAGLLLIGILLIILISDREIGKILIAFGVGITIHVALDFFYLDGVSILWPLTPNRIYLPLGLPLLEELPENFQRFYAAIDIAFDGIYWILIAKLFPIIIDNNDSELDLQRFKKGKKTLKIGGMIVIATFTFFALFGVLVNVLPIEDFVILIYIPGMVVLFISSIIPLYYRDLMLKLDKLPQQWFLNNLR